MNEVIGPNVKRLIAHKMSLDAIPRGGGLNDALNYLSSKDNITESARRAKDWVRLAIRTLRQAAEPNPWKDADDEAIAGEFLRKIDERQRASDKSTSVNATN